MNRKMLQKMLAGIGMLVVAASLAGATPPQTQSGPETDKDPMASDMGTAQDPITPPMGSDMDADDGMGEPEQVVEPTERDPLVQFGDAITFYLSDLTGPGRLVQRVEWRKNLRKRAADYVQLAVRYEITGRPDFAILLVEDESVGRLEYLCPDGDAETCTLTVDEEFQYGGDADGRIRFLVFHDKAHGQYQSRFFGEGLADNFSRGVARFEGGDSATGTLAAVRRVAEHGIDYLGEYLVDVSPQAVEQREVRLVQVGDRISFYPDDLIGMSRVLQQVEWQHKLKKQEATYVQLAARLGDGYVIVFVEEPLAQRLIGRCQDTMSPTCSITIDSEFQYGGDNEGTMRFLVYHNRAHVIFQHRFVNQTMAKNFVVGVEGLRDKADEMNVPMFGAELAVEGIMKVSEMGQAIFGDPLRDF